MDSSPTTRNLAPSAAPRKGGPWTEAKSVHAEVFLPDCQNWAAVQTALEKDPAGPKKERQAVGDIRRHIQATVGGADPLPLQHLLVQVYAGIEQAIATLRQLAETQGPPLRGAAGGVTEARGWDLMAACIEAYYRVLDSLEALDDAIEAADHIALWTAFARLEDSVRTVDRLLEERPQALPIPPRP